MHRQEAGGENLLADTVAFVAVALGEAAGSGVFVDACGHPCGILPLVEWLPITAAFGAIILRLFFRRCGNGGSRHRIRRTCGAGTAATPSAPGSSFGRGLHFH
jgi:hypothetical protein